MRYLLLDVAGTLLHKPDLFIKINLVLSQYDYSIPIERIKYNHKLLSEAIKFPDRTSPQFYKEFNKELLYSLGVIPTEELLNDIFASCSYLPWEKFDDVKILNEIKCPIGIISNFNSSLKEKLNQHFGSIFSDVFVSEELGVAKPDLAFYQNALDKINVDPKDILYIGDSFKLDLQPALQLGMKAYIVDRDDFYSTNDITIKSLSELKRLIEL